MRRARTRRISVWEYEDMGIEERVYRHFHAPSLRRREDGLVLVIVLWVLAILVVLTWGLAATVQTEARLVSHYSESTRCLEYARSGLTLAFQKLSDADLSTVTVLSPPTHLGSEDVGVEFEGNGQFSVNLEDESAKMNLNTATLEMLTALTEDPNLAASIVDWRDEDSAASPGGAEDSFYMGQTEPYHCRNAPFETLEEILLVNGMTREHLTEPPPGRLPIARLLTVYSVDENTDIRGRQRLNLNTASESDLQDGLGDTLTSEEISAIVKFRSGSDSGTRPQPRQSSLPVSPTPPVATGPPSGGSSTSRRFSSTGDLLDVPGLTRDKVRRIADQVTVTDEALVPGRININTADRAVLAALPGMNEAIADDIVAHRNGDEGPFGSAGDILTVDSVTQEVYRQIAELITVRSVFFRLTSTGSIEGSKTTRSIESVVSLLRSDLKQDNQSNPEASAGTQAGNDRRIVLRYWRQGV